MLGEGADTCALSGSLAPPSVDGSHAFHAAGWYSSLSSTAFNMHGTVVGGWEGKEGELSNSNLTEGLRYVSKTPASVKGRG